MQKQILFTILAISSLAPLQLMGDLQPPQQWPIDNETLRQQIQQQIQQYRDALRISSGVQK